MSYILQFIDSTRFLGRSLLNLANNISEVNQRIKCKFECKFATEYKYCDCFLEYTNFR